MQLTATEFKRRFDGYSITDCAVLTNGQYYFISRNDVEAANAGPTAEATVTKRLTYYFPREPEGHRLKHSVFEGYRDLLVGASLKNEERALCISVDALVFATGGATADEDENAIPKGRNGPRRGAIHRVRTIQGAFYAVGSDHTVCVRRGKNQWESLCHNLPAPTLADFDDVDRSDNMAFVDIDGFSANDLYAIAGQGRLWHFDGTKWTAVALPSHLSVHSICCAGDGHVYIGAQSGSIFRGRNDEWKLLVREMFTLPFRDIVWHADQLWLASDYGLWNLTDEKLVEASFPSSEIKVCAGNLSVGDGIMLMAGKHGAAVHNGREWQLIFHSLQFS